MRVVESVPWLPQERFEKDAQAESDDMSGLLRRLCFVVLAAVAIPLLSSSELLAQGKMHILQTSQYKPAPSKKATCQASCNQYIGEKRRACLYYCSVKYGKS